MREYIFLNNNLDTYRKDIKGTRKKKYERLYTECQRLCDEVLPVEHPKKSTTYIGIGIVNLSFMYLLTKEDRYFEKAKEFIFAAVGYEKWGNAHLVNVDLSASWIMFGMSVAYDWLKDDFTEEECKLVKEKLILQSKIMYDYKVENHGTGWSTNYYQNHNWINMTGLAAAGYVLKDEYEFAKEYIEISKENFDRVYSYLSDDGSNYEGVVYWHYGVLWLFVYADMVKKQGDTDYFKTSKFLENTFFYKLYQTMPNLEETANFGDCHDRRSGHSSAIYYKTAEEYDNGYAQFLGDYVLDNLLYKEHYNSKLKPGIISECFFEFIWYDPKIESKNLDELPLYRHFEDLGLISIRDSWDKDALFFSLKCGAPGGKKQWKKLWELYNQEKINAFSLSHNHPDNNSFILNKNGTYFAIDDGYNRNIKAIDHNTIVVDDETCEIDDVNDVLVKSAFKLLEDGFNPEKELTGEIINFNAEKDFISFTGDNKGYYKKSLKINDCKRTVIYSKNKFFIMIDNVVSDSKHEYSYVLNSDKHPRVEEDYLLYNYPLEDMYLYSILPKHKKINMINNTIKAVMTTQEPDNFVTNRMKTLKISTSEKVTNTFFVNVFSFEKIEIEHIETDEFIDIRVGKYNENYRYNKKLSIVEKR